ncbi:MAG: ABC transporter permease [Gemmatimonadaceae bacterium]
MWRLATDRADLWRRAANTTRSAVPRRKLRHDGWVRTTSVDPHLFSVLDVPIVAGDSLGDADARDSTVIMVDQLLVKSYLAGAPALGRRIRVLKQTSDIEYANLEPGPWLEIVGAVPDFTPEFETTGARASSQDETFDVLKVPRSCSRQRLAEDE